MGDDPGAPGSHTLLRIESSKKYFLNAYTSTFEVWRLNGYKFFLKGEVTSPRPQKNYDISILQKTKKIGILFFESNFSIKN